MSGSLWKVEIKWTLNPYMEQLAICGRETVTTTSGWLSITCYRSVKLQMELKSSSWGNYFFFFLFCFSRKGQPASKPSNKPITFPAVTTMHIYIYIYMLSLIINRFVILKNWITRRRGSYIRNIHHLFLLWKPREININLKYRP